MKRVTSVIILIERENNPDDAGHLIVVEAKSPRHHPVGWCRGALVFGHQMRSSQNYRLSGISEASRKLPCKCNRALSRVCRLLLLMCGDVERNPGPLSKGAQWNVGALSPPKRLVLEKLLYEEQVTFCLLSETHFSKMECEAFSIRGYQHLGLARTPHGGGVSILVQDGIGVIRGADAPSGEIVSATLVFAGNLKLHVTSAYFPRKAHLTDESLRNILVVDENTPLIIGADVNTHHPLWDPSRAADRQGTRLADWATDNGVLFANSGAPTRRKPGSAERSSPDVTMYRGCSVEDWLSTLSGDSDHYWITFSVVLGSSIELIAPAVPRRLLYAWSKANWRKYQVEVAIRLRKVKWSQLKGVDQWNRALTGCIREATNVAVPKGGTAAPPGWTPELTELDRLIHTAGNERIREELVVQRRPTEEICSQDVQQELSNGCCRPVTLTSTLCKLMERMVARRLRDQIETQLQPQQAGFRPHRSTTNALVQIEALLMRPTQSSRTAAVFVDYARAFDSVDHGCILDALRRLRVNNEMQRWIGSFLSTRTARVRVNNTLSSAVAMTCGVPQGSVLGPILFIIVMDSLNARLNDIPGLHHGFFADDLSLLCQDSDRSTIQTTLQRGLDCVAEWSAQHYMELSASKTQYTFFGVKNPASLTLKVNGHLLKNVATPKVLGCTFQPHKGSTVHVREMVKSLRLQLARLRAVSSPEWGPSRETLRALYLALIQSKMLYAAGAWWFHASASDRKLMEALQVAAAHIICGVPRAASRTDILQEARLIPLDKAAEYRALEYFLKARERGGLQREYASRLFGSDHPIREALDLVRTLYDSVDGFHDPLPHTAVVLARRIYFQCAPPVGLTADDDDCLKKLFTQHRVDKFDDYDFQLWTDGSVDLDVAAGSAALLFARDGSLRRKVVSDAGSLACSYRAECVAMEIGLAALLDHVSDTNTKRLRVAVFSDSLSLLMALQTGPHCARDGVLQRIWRHILTLLNRSVRLSFQFVFSHCGIPRNEAVDKAAAEGRGLPQRYPAWITDIVTGIKRVCRRAADATFDDGGGPITYRSTLLQHIHPAPKRLGFDRNGQSLLAQFFTGTSRHFGWLQRVLTRSTRQLHCRWCHPTAASDDPLSPLSSPPSVSSPGLLVASRRMDPVVCPVCLVISANKQALQVHLTTKHQWTLTKAKEVLHCVVRAPAPYNGQLKCHLCLEIFSRRGLLEAHMLSHRPPNAPQDFLYLAVPLPSTTSRRRQREPTPPPSPERAASPTPPASPRTPPVSPARTRPRLEHIVSPASPLQCERCGRAYWYGKGDYTAHGQSPSGSRSCYPSCSSGACGPKTTGGNLEQAENRKRRREEENSFECGRCGSCYKEWSILVWHTRHHHDEALSVERRMLSGAVQSTPLRKRALLCPHCQRRFTDKQYLTQHLIAFHDGDAPEDVHNHLKETCEETSRHMLECPALGAMRRECGLRGSVEEQLASMKLPWFLSRLFGLPKPVLLPLPPRLEKRHAPSEVPVPDQMAVPLRRRRRDSSPTLESDLLGWTTRQQHRPHLPPSASNFEEKRVTASVPLAPPQQRTWEEARRLHPPRVDRKLEDPPRPERQRRAD
eukprot:gene12730-8679_t